VYGVSHWLRVVLGCVVVPSRPFVCCRTVRRFCLCLVWVCFDLWNLFVVRLFGGSV